MSEFDFDREDSSSRGKRKPPGSARIQSGSLRVIAFSSVAIVVLLGSVIGLFWFGIFSIGKRINDEASPVDPKTDNPVFQREKAVDVGTWFNVDGVQVGVSKVELAPVKYTDRITGKESESPTILAVTLQVRSKTDTKKIDLRRWGRPILLDDVSLTDEHGNSYKLIFPGIFDEVEGFKEKAIVSVMPGQVDKNTIFFETPIPKAKRLMLKLDAKNIGSVGQIQFVIQEQNWKK